ncbi:MAG: hypothetical protein ACK44O_01835 [Novosphingobium sp.]
MRGGTEQVTYAKGTVTRAGRRVALVNAEAWQDDRAKPAISIRPDMAPPCRKPGRPATRLE